MKLIVRIFLCLSLIAIGGQCDFPEKRPLIVTTIIGAPYVMQRDSSTNLTGNDRFEGFIIDVVESISKMLDFNYTLEINPSGMYGSFDKASGKWNGMVGDLIDGLADIAASDLTMTSAREMAIDFTAPFTFLGLGVLHKRGQQHFTNIEELASQTNVTYGCIRGGSTEAFFRNSDYPLYMKMWSNMVENDASAFVSSNSEGVERVLEGDYAFFAESTTIEYVTARICDLYQVNGLLDQKGFGLAVPKGSPFRSLLSSALLRLQEDGSLFRLKNKWWREKNTAVDY